MSGTPNLKQIKSKIGSLDNSNYKPSGGDIKVETRKLEWKASARTSNFNDRYVPKGGEKKVTL